ncbi:hypothetical protein Tco_0720160 [Tanacetum coccineum]
MYLLQLLYRLGLSLPPPTLSKSSSDTEAAALIIANGALEMPHTGSTYEVGGPSSVSLFPPFYLHGREIARLDDNTELLLSNVKYLERCEKKRQAEMEANSSKIRKVKRRMDNFDRDLGGFLDLLVSVSGPFWTVLLTPYGSNMRWRGPSVYIPISSILSAYGERGDCDLRSVEGRVTELEDKDQEKTEEIEKMKKRLETFKTNYRFGRGTIDARPDDGVDGSAAFGESQPPKLPGSPSSSQ